jgi:hypothetical protein
MIRTVFLCVVRLSPVAIHKIPLSSFKVINGMFKDLPFAMFFPVCLHDSVFVYDKILKELHQRLNPQTR